MVDERARTYAVRKLVLTEFRNHSFLKLDIPNAPVMISGANGSGKTNILEALSLFAPGRGLRGATTSDLPRLHAKDADKRWGAAALVSSGDEPVKIAVSAGDTSASKKFFVEGEKASKSGDIASHIRAIWYTPSRRHKITENASERRRWFDSLIAANVPEHDRALRGYDHYIRERMRLLQRGINDDIWLTRVEREAAIRGGAIAARRNDMITLLEKTQPADNGFPHATLSIVQAPSVDPDNFAAALKEHRAEDRAAGRTRYGAHRSDISLVYAEKQTPLGLCSAGEQKALIFSVMLRYVAMLEQRAGYIPVLLLDEAFSELDPDRQRALCAALDSAGAQYWLTGPDAALFAPYENRALHIRL